MKIVQNHKLGLAEARVRVNRFGDFLVKNGIGVTWESKDVAKVSGKYIVVQIDATVVVSEDKVVIEGKDPGFLWRKKANEFLQEKMAEYLK